jgi:hypothetical protein
MFGEMRRDLDMGDDVLARWILRRQIVEIVMVKLASADGAVKERVRDPAEPLTPIVAGRKARSWRPSFVLTLREDASGTAIHRPVPSIRRARWGRWGTLTECRRVLVVLVIAKLLEDAAHHILQPLLRTSHRRQLDLV